LWFDEHKRILMKKIYLNTGNVEDVIMELKTTLNGSLNYDSNEYNLTLNNQLIKGNIQAVSFNEGMKYLQFDIVFFDDVTLSINSCDSSPIYFAYCSHGSMEHSFGELKEKNNIEKHNTAVINTVNNSSNVLYFKKNIPLQFTLIGVATSNEEGIDSLNTKLKNTFKNKKESFIHIGQQHIKIEEKIGQLRAVAQKGIVGTLLKKGILQIILAMEIEQHTNRYTDQKAIVNCLTLKQIEQIKKVSDVIKQNPAEQYTIKTLAETTGLSPNKLQEGFKLIHNRTVNDFITLIRIEKAKNLIINSDLNISEIVYSIGFTSRSYFSKIFKEKYNCSPNKYKYAQNSLAITA